MEIDSGVRFYLHGTNIAEEDVSQVKRSCQSKMGPEIRIPPLVISSHLHPLITYGAEAWAMYATQRDVKKLTSAQRVALLVTTRKYHTVSEPALLVIVDAISMSHELQREELRYAIRRRTATTIRGTI